MPFYKNKKILSFLILTLLIVPQLVFAGATDDIITNLGVFQSIVGLPSGQADPVAIAANVINALLSVLGLIFVILVIYSGFKWMLSRGKEDDVKKARETLKNAIIGVAIILLALVINNIVFSIILKIASGNSNVLD